MSYPKWDITLGYLMDTPDFVYAFNPDELMRWVQEFAKDRLIGRYTLTFVGRVSRVEAWLARRGEERLFLVAERRRVK